MSAGSTTFPTTIDDNAEALGGKQTEITSTLYNNHSVQIEALETKVGADSSAVNTSHDYKLSGVTGTDKAVSKTGTETLTNKTLTSPLFQGTVDGWISANETWTYATATTVTVPTDLTGKYQLGDKVKLTQTTAKYFVIAATPTYSSPNTTLTLHPYDSTTSVADAAITANYYSRAENPYGFPAIPRCSVWGGQLNIANNSTVTVVLDNENFDIGANFSVVTYKFTAPITAYYDVKAAISFDDVVDASRFELVINGSAGNYSQIFANSGSTNFLGITTSREIYVAKGATVYLSARQVTGTATVDILDNNVYTFMDVKFNGVK